MQTIRISIEITKTRHSIAELLDNSFAVSSVSPFSLWHFHELQYTPNNESWKIIQLSLTDKFYYF